MDWNRRPMRRALLAVAMLAVAFLFLSSPAAATPIPGTPVQILDLEPSTKTIPFGAETNFSWAVFNGGPQSYSVRVTTNASSSDFAMELFPVTFTLARDQFRVVQLNVTAPSNG